jgi:hypothetical protein
MFHGSPLLQWTPDGQKITVRAKSFSRWAWLVSMAGDVSAFTGGE